jgi:subtilisin family serine protease
MQRYVSLLTLSVLLLCSFALRTDEPFQKFGVKLKGIYDSLGNDDEVVIWISFRDKGNQLKSVPHINSLGLTERTLLRRSKVRTTEQLIDAEDYPLEQRYVTAVQPYVVKVRQQSKWFNAVSAVAKKNDLTTLAQFDFVREIELVARFARQTDDVEMKSEHIADKDVAPLPQNPSSMHDVKPTPFALDYGTSFTQLNQINVPAVHNLGIYGQGVIVGMFDAGVNFLEHISFDSMTIIAAYDFVNNDPNVDDQLGPDMGEGSHGTQTLSVIGGFTPGYLIGPAFKAKYILAKTENTDSETPIEEDNWIRALEWAEGKGADVISSSLGYLTYDYPHKSYTWRDMNGSTAKITIAADKAADRGVVVCNSAGNGGSNSTRNTLGAPADGKTVIAVGAVTSTGTRSSFSSVGPTTDGRVKPDVMAMGSNVRMASIVFGNAFATGSGTSFSCPLAAGVCALLLSAHPNWTPAQVRAALRNTASRSQNPDNQYGWGIVNALAALNYAIPTTIEQVSHMPSAFYLEQNYPNPFNPTTNIEFRVPNSDGRSSTFVTLKVYDVLGREIATLVSERKEAGSYNITFDSASGTILPSGVYFYRLVIGTQDVNASSLFSPPLFSETKKMVLAK